MNSPHAVRFTGKSTILSSQHTRDSVLYWCMECEQDWAPKDGELLFGATLRYEKAHMQELHKPPEPADWTSAPRSKLHRGDRVCAIADMSSHGGAGGMLSVWHHSRGAWELILHVRDLRADCKADCEVALALHTGSGKFSTRSSAQEDFAAIFTGVRYAALDTERPAAAATLPSVALAGFAAINTVVAESASSLPLGRKTWARARGGGGCGGAPARGCTSYTHSARPLKIRIVVLCPYLFVCVFERL